MSGSDGCAHCGEVCYHMALLPGDVLRMKLQSGDLSVGFAIVTGVVAGGYAKVWIDRQGGWKWFEGVDAHGFLSYDWVLVSR